ncbi:ATP-binding cassette domain-containing protein [Lederbergia sp. NSJ-179]|uniref:ATP-binding cassette domain-containing protein n=1 Tax=Lederbergia sp. NSJ-179 TaxID=2931402 RepID=UPI001FD3B7B9|nr:ATP-binding cassette domain-containing protein [Lederbergia sp. NSJ-179]MCJ7841343.1 ATP-binding cassette domain-containing protein [Lederbergia sp. NSJ-179]
MSLKEIKEWIEILYEELALRDMKKLIAPCYRHWDDLLFNQYCDRFELPLRQNMKTFSDGMKIKASLALALSHHADLLIMDEPTTDLDQIFRREWMELLHEVMLDEDKTIFCRLILWVIYHPLPTISPLSKRDRLSFQRDCTK